MSDIELSLRPTWPDVKNDYAVIWTSERWGKWPIGRIRRADEMSWSGIDHWKWNVTIPLPLRSSSGDEPTLDEATKAFRKFWEETLPTLHPDRELQHAFDVQSAGERRLKMLKD